MIKGTRQEILTRIGASVASHRLQANISQQVLAERCGVSLNAIRHLERGTGATLWTFVQVCRTLGKDRWIADLEPKESLSPIAFAEALSKARKVKARVRATGRKRGLVGSLTVQTHF